PLGFVPTMGFLHEGHIALVHQSVDENKATVVSLFVNPTQFAPTEDLANYPRNEESDFRLLEAAGANVVFAPQAEEMYADNHETWVVLDHLTRRLEGTIRPTHFQGVATVVSQLFHIVEPQSAYFGQKDAQQVLVIDRMIRDLHYPVLLRVVETVREPDGLAMSSRNTYLSPEERLAGPVLRRSLELAEELWLEGERDAERIRKEMTDLIEQEPLARVDYVSIADTRTLDEIHVIDRKALVSLAVRIGKTRLIDNAILPPGEPLIARRQA
ncbi:MAG: pantoate--beta-alanine ligase, partial [Candidatus Bipolaricaulota bacterium]|nr:pantoate--beta-alanine ligase [Candidatus Bipolaricaulota bacterium]